MKIEVITASKIFQTSKRKQEILSKLNATGINSLLQIQEPEEVHEPNTVHVDEIKEREEAEVDLDTGEDVEVEDVDIDDGVKEREPKPEKKASHSSHNPPKEQGHEDKGVQEKAPYSDRPVLEEVPALSSDQVELDDEQSVEGSAAYLVDGCDVDEDGEAHKIAATDEVDEEQEEPETVEAQEQTSEQQEVVESSTGQDNDMFEVEATEDKPVQLKIEDIKGYLNSIEETKGLSRVRVKENKELWLYYNDNINLNDVMGDVIDQLLKTNVDLEFNRLARSDNAMVFMLMQDDTDIEQKSEKEIDEAVEEAEKN